MLQALHLSPNVFAQAGIFYGQGAYTSETEHPFVEVIYPELPSTGVNGTFEFLYPLTSGTFGVEVAGPSNQPIPVACNWPQSLVNTCVSTNSEEIIFTLNGKPLIASFIPRQYAPDLIQADLAAEVHSSNARIPGTCTHPLVFSDAHVYNGGAWHAWEMSGGILDSPTDMAQKVSPQGLSVWALPCS
jgi:hypothetical protein